MKIAVIGVGEVGAAVADHFTMIVIPFGSLVDLFPLVSAKLGDHSVKLSTNTSDDYAVVIPIYNNFHEKIDLSRLILLHGHVFFAVPANTHENYKTLTRYGQVIECPVADITTYNLLKEAVKQIPKAFNVIFLMDGDTFPSDHTFFERVAATILENDIDIASLYVVPEKNGRLIEHLQEVEYHIAMKARRHRPWMTSGACIVGRSEAIKVALEHHSGFQLGDVELGMIAHRLKLKVKHIPEAVFYTAIPNTFLSWVKQRIRWMAGSFRNEVINIHMSIRHPFNILYYILLVYLLLPWKILEPIITFKPLNMSQSIPYIIPIPTLHIPFTFLPWIDIIMSWPIFWVWLSYLLINFINIKFNGTTVRPLAFITFPFYSLLQVTVINLLGILSLPFWKGSKIIRIR